MRSDVDTNIPFAEVRTNLEQARTAAQIYVNAQLQRFAAIVRASILYALLGLVAAVIAVAVLVSAAVLLLNGVAGMISNVLGGRQWAGDLVTGGGVVFVALVGAYLAVRVILASARSKTVSSFQQPGKPK